MTKHRTSLKEALRACGMPDGFGIDSPSDIEEFHDKWKIELITARRNNDTQKAADLSQAWELVKRYRDKWCACGRIKGRGARLCPACNSVHRNGRSRGVPEFCIGVVTDGVLIDSTKRSKLYLALNSLDAVGKSVVLDNKGETIRAAACKLGIKVKVYQIVDENGNKTQLFRVWRTDGLPIEKVNAEILKRSPAQSP